MRRVEVYIATELNEKLGARLRAAASQISVIAYLVTPNSSPLRHGHPSLLRTMREIGHHPIDCRMILATSNKSPGLNEANVRVAEILTADKWRVRFAPPYPLAHCKIWIFDAAYAVVGSHNLTTPGLTANNDISIGIDHPDIIARLRNFYDELWDKSRHHQR